MRSDKSFREFLKSAPTLGAVIIALGLGLLLVFISPSVGVEQSEEEELTEICASLEGVGRCRAVINYTESGEVFSVAVLCDGAENLIVKERIVQLVSSLYGIGANRIAVLKID